MDPTTSPVSVWVERRAPLRDPVATHPHPNVGLISKKWTKKDSPKVFSVNEQKTPTPV